VLAAMLRGLGATVTPVRAPFEPEAGAYRGGSPRAFRRCEARGIIHDFATGPARR
jgi:hypothetical protein